MKQSSVVNEYKGVCQRSRSFFGTARVVFLSLAGNATGFFLRGMCGSTSRKLRGNMHGSGCRLINKCLALSYTTSQSRLIPKTGKKKYHIKFDANMSNFIHRAPRKPGAGESKCYRFN